MDQYPCSSITHSNDQALKICRNDMGVLPINEDVSVDKNSQPCLHHFIRTFATFALILATPLVGLSCGLPAFLLFAEGNPPAISSTYHVWRVFPDLCAQHPE